MLLGAAGTLPDRRNWLLAGADRQTRILNDGQAALDVRPWGIPGLDRFERWAEDEPTGSWLALSGRPIYGDPQTSDGDAGAGRLLARLLESGPTALAELDGAFAIAWFDGRVSRLHLIRNRTSVLCRYRPGGTLRVAAARPARHRRADRWPRWRRAR
jgi:hypothetical protein